MLTSHRIFRFLLVIFLGELSLIAYFNLPLRQKSDQSTRYSEKGSVQLRHSSHLEKGDSLEKLFQRVPVSNVPESRVLAGIIPHHLLAAELIASFFKGLEGQSVKTVVLLGPNHRNIGKHSIITSKAVWETPLGDLEPDLGVINSLLSLDSVGQEEFVFDEEHSIYGLTSFIKKAFPDARVVPLVLASFVGESQARELGRKLAEELGDGSLVLVSADFAHQVTASQAATKDQKSIEALKTLDSDSIGLITSDNNPSFYALFSYLEGRRNLPVLVSNSNSYEISKTHPESATSYVTMYFSESESGLTFEQISPANHVFSASTSPDLVTAVFTGDVLLARTVNYRIQQLHNPSYPFEETATVLQSADLTFVNLENPLVAECPPTNAGMIFCGDLGNAQGLTDAGVDLAAVTNNHALDQGSSGLAETVLALAEAGVTSVGQGELVVRAVRGRKFGFLAYDTLKSRVDSASVAAAVGQAKQEVDCVLVYFHWGEEYTAQPADWQRELGHAVIDAGADAVVGSHPHWIQGVELYQGKPIIYSLGNFVFDQGWSEETQEGIVARLSFDGDRLVAWEFLPVRIENWTQPRFLEGEEKARILEEMEQLNADLNP